MRNEKLSWRFKRFAIDECRGSSNLYEHLSYQIAEDDEILDLCLNATAGQPVPNLLFGAVHYLLLKGKKHKLGQYYPSIVKHPLAVDEAFIYFKDFCQQFEKEIIEILKSRLVQTNEVRRCAYLFPSFCYIYNKVAKPLSLIEIGTSAGLQLLWDRYSYSYGTDEVYGDKDSAVLVTSEMKDKQPPPYLTKIPPVVSRMGLDLHVSNLRNQEDYLWLKSLIWPEHRDRLTLFEQAAHCFKENPVELREGDGIVLLPDIIETIPSEATIGIFHTHVANQIPEPSKWTLIDKIKKIGARRDIFHLYNNMWDRELHLDYFIDGVEYKQVIGKTDGHGKWFEWNVE